MQDDLIPEKDFTRDVSLLVAIARIEAEVQRCAAELERIPGRLAAIEKRLSAIDHNETTTVGDLERMKKERRDLEHGLEDAEAAVTKYKNQLMSVKTNKEYTAMLKEIELKASEIGQKEERLLELMVAIEERGEKSDAVLAGAATDRAEATAAKNTLVERRAVLEAEMKNLSFEKPKLLAEVDPAVRKRYQRVHDKHGEVAVTRTEGGYCGGCGTQLPPQVVVEVKKNNQLLTCQSCGRILVDFA
jgi:hypothetical protein